MDTEQIDAVPAQKLRFSSSVAARRLRCPGSAKAEAIAPSLGDTDYAREGTALHAVMECVLEDYLEGLEAQIDFGGYVGQEIESVVIDDDMADGAAAAFGHFKELEERYGLVAADTVYLETEVPYPELDGQRTIIDFVCETPDLIFILDWKFGKGFDVDAVWNEQLAYNATAVATNLFSESRGKRIVSAIVQPFARDRPVKTWEIRQKDLVHFHAEHMAAFDSAVSKHPKFALGPHCRWCSANGTTCPAVNQLGDQLARVSKEEIVQRLVLNLERGDMLKKSIDNAAAACLERLEKGDPVPGWKLVAKRSNRAWTDEKKAMQWGRRQGLKKADMVEEKFVTPAKMEKAVAKHGKVPDIALPAKLVDQPFTGATIAPESDGRPAIQPRVQRAAGIEAKLSTAKE